MNDEKEAWHKDLDVFYQDNAWADTEFWVNWINKALKSATERNGQFVLFRDNFSAKICHVSAIGGLLWYGVPNAADLSLLVDADFGELLKVLSKQEQKHWLDCDENAHRWYGNIDPSSAKEWPMLITQPVGNAYNKLISQDFKP